MPEMANSWEFVNYFDDASFNLPTHNHWYPDISYMEKVKDYYDGLLDPKDVVGVQTVQAEMVPNGTMTGQTATWTG
jgi:hypothetical protein